MYRFLAFAQAIILAAMLLVVPFTSPSDALASNRPQLVEMLGTVDGERIMATIEDLQNFGSRAFYLNGSQETAEYVHKRFMDLGLDAEYQDFNAGIHPSQNVVATLQGSLDPDRRFLIGAHYDSENSMATSLSLAENLTAPGADDDASGVAAMIEIATVLQGLSLNYTMKYVAFGAEELGYDHGGGLKGSFFYVASEKSKNHSYEGSAILDMIGYQGDSGNHATIVVDDENNALANATMEAISAQDLNLSVVVAVNPTIGYSDHYPFWLAGYPSMLVCEAAPYTGVPYEFNPFYHSEQDTVDHLSQDQMTEITKALLAGILAMNGLAIEENGPSVTTTLVLVALCAVVAVLVIYYISRVKK